MVHVTKQQLKFINIRCNSVKNLEGPWPEYVGIKGDVAKDILSLDTGLKVQVLKKGSPTTRDYRLDRVRIFVDEEGIVTNIPKKG